MKKYKLPKGFLASGIHCGIKKKRKDLSLFFSEKLCKSAAVFTTNAVKAAPVVLAQEQLKKNGKVKAVLVNSGNANCMTGKRGMADARKMASNMAALLGADEDTVIVSSTGIIGELLDMKPINAGMKILAGTLSASGLNDAAEGIITTDNYIKVSTRVFTVSGKKITITGVAKGAGMIHPDMATTLCFLFTDADISVKALRTSLKESADVSFNSITVDGDMSTNDTMMLMANGAAGNKAIQPGTGAFKLFLKNLNDVSMDLAKMIVKDGEGANKLIEVSVSGARNKEDAIRAAKGVAGSLLVKCAVLGGDPNWGRIASSVGASGAAVNPDKLVIKLDGVTFFSKGKATKQVDRKKSKIFKKPKVKIDVNIAMGKSEAKVYSCDISKKYITLNSYYTT